ncbi:hypothetical protein DZB91_24055 [Brevibacillus sp. VP]|uniref:hypothetical protein n=1 Tax=Brevibacillus sp. VP TaxID=2293326 RepID=UPI000E2FCE4F|nr:hypothetical protein [Brevibacillus sp. VP]RFB28277.1 hypothetical protein DZB91_24055 [Brevibacillus sp. VP]
MWQPITNLLKLLEEGKTNLSYTLVAVATVAILCFFIKYKQGNDSEKIESIKKIKGTVYALLGSQALLWFLPYAFNIFKFV